MLGLGIGHDGPKLFLCGVEVVRALTVVVMLLIAAVKAVSIDEERKRKHYSVWKVKEDTFEWIC